MAKGGIDHDRVRARLVGKFVARLGEGTAARVRFVDAVQRTPGGKVRVVSRG